MIHRFWPESTGSVEVINGYYNSRGCCFGLDRPRCCFSSDVVLMEEIGSGSFGTGFISTSYSKYSKTVIDLLTPHPHSSNWSGHRCRSGRIFGQDLYERV